MRKGGARTVRSQALRAKKNNYERYSILQQKYFKMTASNKGTNSGYGASPHTTGMPTALTVFRSHVPHAHEIYIYIHIYTLYIHIYTQGNLALNDAFRAGLQLPSSLLAGFRVLTARGSCEKRRSEKGAFAGADSENTTNLYLCWVGRYTNTYINIYKYVYIYIYI